MEPGRERGQELSWERGKIIWICGQVLSNCNFFYSFNYVESLVSLCLSSHTHILSLSVFFPFFICLFLWVSFPVYLCLSPFFLFLSLLINTSCSFMTRIETMYWSLDILHNLPGHEERKETCETLSCALLAALRPRVRRDILNLDLSPLQEYLYVYQKLGRSVIFHYGIYFYFSLFNISVPLWVNFLVEGGRS